jgi:2-methylisocitrate lyase-like PEP mutase family enzyme
VGAVAGLLVERGEPRRVFRERLAGGEPVVAPGAYDALSARLIEAAGFAAVYMTGFGTTASLIGRPDVGLLSGAEMIDNARRITQAVSVPVVADADTGYGNPLNVIRTVRDYEAAGVAALHIEDQSMPKRCGHVIGKALVPVEEMVAKVEAAVAARTDADLVIIARTDARAVEGLDAALERAQRYAAAGADALFVEAPTSRGEIEVIAQAFPETPLVFNWAEGGRTPPVGLETLAELGFALVLFPVGALLAATAGIRSLLETLRADGTPAQALPDWPGFAEFCSFIGFDEITELEERFRS